ncbi:MAG TPA: histidine--tRNA ligase [Polyangiaceae bacterium]|nr:histidine--tRNA ligase [Polyangiaceae bacterium]
MSFRAVKGMNDILPEEIRRWQRIEATFRDTVELYGYEEVRTPVVEPTGLFVRSIGEATDVVDKEMYTFERHRESLTLRPEGTAGAARAFVEHSQHARQPITRWFYIGPMFRAEQPQRGRYRQFHQAGGEVYGDVGPFCDAEMIAMLADFYQRLEIPGVRIQINSIGGTESRLRHREALLEFLRPKAESLSEHARERLELNPLRVLDSKDPRDRAASEGAPSVLDYLVEEDQIHWSGLRRALDAMKIEYHVTPGLVRGLDYYTRTLFEITASGGDLGTQNALCGGGRYDKMIEGLGGPSMPAVGFAMGLERLLLALPAQEYPSRPLCFFAPMGTTEIERSLEFAQALRQRGIRAEVDSRGGRLKAMLRRADSIKAQLVIVLGETELERSMAAVKDLGAHNQVEIPFERLVDEIVERLTFEPGRIA